MTYYELPSIYGHDTFLLDVVAVGAAVKVGHLMSIRKTCMQFSTQSGRSKSSIQIPRIGKVITYEKIPHYWTCLIGCLSEVYTERGS